MYQDVRNQMGQFDLISFSGKGTVSNIIKVGTNSDISHVAMVYRICELNIQLFEKFEQLLETDRVLIIESTSLVEIEDAVHGELIKGVQIQYLSDRINSYEGQIYWHKLRNPISEARQAAMYAWLTTQHLKRIKYDSVGAVRSGIDIFDYILESKPDYEKLFCSEMVAKAYEIAGLFIGNPSEQTPDDVISYPFLEQRVQIK
jgi:hypothetical protein